MKFLSKSYTNYFDQLYVFILIIYAGSATVFVRSMATWVNPIGLFLPIILSIALGFIHKVNISRTFLYLIFGYTVFNLILAIKFHAIHPRFYGTYLISFFIAYMAISSLRVRFFIYYEQILYYLCIIALIFWGINLVIPEPFSKLLSKIAFSEPGAGNVDSNIIFYTINNLSDIHFGQQSIEGLHLIRNSGYAWEPGGFACYINLAIFINLIRTKFRLQNNKKLWTLIITLFTTFSTTGFSIFLLLIVFYAYNQHLRYALLLIPITICLGIAIINLPFMTEKLVNVSEYDTDQMIENAIEYDEQYTPQRLESFQIDFIDFLNNPIFGYGGHMEERWTKKLGAEIATISGLGKVMSVFGIVGILFFLISLTKTSIEFTKLFRFNGWIFPFLIIIMISISYSIIFTSLLMCFWLITPAYLGKKEKLHYIIEKIKILKIHSRIA